MNVNQYTKEIDDNHAAQRVANEMKPTEEVKSVEQLAAAIEPNNNYNTIKAKEEDEWQLISVNTNNAEKAATSENTTSSDAVNSEVKKAKKKMVTGALLNYLKQCQSEDQEIQF